MNGELITKENFMSTGGLDNIPVFHVLRFGKYRNLRSTGRILYGVLYSYLHISEEKGYVNKHKDNALYVKMSRDSLWKFMHISSNTLHKYLQMLEELNLIEIDRKPSRIIDEIYLRYPVRHGHLSEKEEAFLRAEEQGLDFPDID